MKQTKINLFSYALEPGLFVILAAFFATGCTSVFSVKTDPLQADVFYIDPSTGEEKPLGKTPLEMKTTELRQTVGDGIMTGEFFVVGIQKPGFQTQTFNIPVTRFGTLTTTLDVKLKEGANSVKEEKTAKQIIDRLFLAQKFALLLQYERAHLELDRLLNDFPQFSRAMSMRASIYFAQKNFTESLKWYDEALRIDPNLEDAVKMAAKVRSQLGIRQPAAVTIPPGQTGGVQ